MGTPKLARTEQQQSNKLKSQTREGEILAWRQLFVKPSVVVFSESVEIRWRSNIRCGMKHGSRRRTAVGSVLWNGTTVAGSPHLASAGSSLQRKKAWKKKARQWEQSHGGNVYSICYARGLILQERASRRASQHLAKPTAIRHAALSTEEDRTAEHFVLNFWGADWGIVLFFPLVLFFVFVFFTQNQTTLTTVFFIRQCRWQNDKIPISSQNNKNKSKHGISWTCVGFLTNLKQGQL